MASVQAGEIMNPTEKRYVLHTALRASADQTVMVSRPTGARLRMVG